MASGAVQGDGFDLRNEFAADFGDPRLSQRLQLLVEALSRNPSASFPEQLRDPSQLESFYRFIRNPRVEFGDVLEPHQLATVERAMTAGEVAVIHDTTDFGFPIYGDTLRPGLCKFSRKRQGFLTHASLVVSTAPVCPLGVLSAQPFPYQSQLPNAASKRFWQQSFGLMKSTYDRWLKGVRQTAALLENVPSVVHLMDREADSYEILADSEMHGTRYVVRLTYDRRSEIPSGELAYISANFVDLKPVATRVIELGARYEKPRGPRSRDAQPPRPRRTAAVDVYASAVTLQRPKRRPEWSHLPAKITINVVRVVEPSPPKGEEPVTWTLATTEPIDTPSEVLRIVDLYRMRWLIEEYFKAVKTGCSFEKRQLESAQSLLIALAMLLPIAWRLLLLRHLGDTTLSAETVVSKTQLQILRSEVPKVSWEQIPTVSNVHMAIARLGGHLRNNGPPGWQVLGRGFTRLLEMERGWLAALKAHKRTCDQS